MVADNYAGTLSVITANLVKNLRSLGYDLAGREDHAGALLKLSGLLDEDYYKSKYPDVVASGMEPAIHFVRFGWKEQRSPAKYFEGLAMENDSQSFKDYLMRLGVHLKARKEAGQKPKILRQGSYEAMYDMPLRVDWGITHMCNYHCSYCFGQTPLDKTKFPPLRDFVNALDNLASLNRPGYSFNFGGGEPTSYPSFLEFLHILVGKLQGRIKKVLIITNGSRSLEFFRKLGDISFLIPLNLQISIHTDHVDPEHIARLIPVLHDKVNLIFSLMCNPTKWELVNAIYDRLAVMREKYYFNLRLAFLREPPRFDIPDRRYGNEHNEWRLERQAMFNKIASASGLKPPFAIPPDFMGFWEYEEKGVVSFSRGGDRESQFARGMFAFRDMYCVTGTHLLNVKANGDCFGAVCSVAKPVCNIFKPNVFKDCDPYKILKCPLPNCGCGSNDNLLKFRDATEADIFLKMFRIRECQVR